MLSGSLSIAAIEIKTTSANGDVQFEATGKPSMLKIKGLGEGAIADLKVDKGLLSGTVRFKLSTLDSGIELRDKHMKEKYLQTGEFPEAILTFKNFSLPANWDAKNPVLKETEFQGTLKLHGIEKPISGHFQIADSKMKMQSDFELNLSDYNIDIPTYLGIKVADTVKVQVHFNTMNVSESGAKTKK